MLEVGTRWPRFTVEFDYQRKDRRNAIISGYRPPLVDLMDRVRGGDLLLIRGAHEPEE